MSTKIHPELDIWLWPLEAITIPSAPPKCLVDQLSHIPRDDEHEKEGDRPQWWVRTPVEMYGVISGPPEGSQQTTRLREIQGLKWWTFQDRATGANIAGYTLAPRCVPRCTYMEDIPGKGALILPGDRWFLFGFRRLWGDFWNNVTPDDADGTGAIAWYCAAPPGAQYAAPDNAEEIREIQTLVEDSSHAYSGACYVAESNKIQPAAVSFAVCLWLGAAAPGCQPWFRLSWADNRYSLLIHDGLPPVLSIGKPGHDPYWRRADIASEASPDWFGSPDPVLIRVLYIAGRMVVQVDANKSVYTLVYGTSQEGATTAIAPRAGRIAISGAWAPVTLRMYDILWGQLKTEKTGAKPRNPEGIPSTRELIEPKGSFKRRFIALRTSTAMEAYALGWSPSQAAQAGATMTDIYSPARVTVAKTDEPGVREYTCELYGIPEEAQPIDYIAKLDDGPGHEHRNDVCLRGGKTPFVHTVVVNYARGGRKKSLAPLNLRPAVSRATERAEDPILSPGPSWRLSVSREVLPDCALENGTVVGDGWRQYVQRYHPAVVDVRWRRSDGTATQTYRRLDGWLWSRDPELSGAPAQRTMELELRDHTARLMRPAAVVDERFMPLDAVIWQKASRLRAGSLAGLYGWEAVQYILEMLWGAELAASLEHYMPADWYPLLDYRIVVGDMPSGGLLFPPPWGQSVWDWIRRICDIDFAVFFFGGSMAGANRLAPIYGNYFEIVRAAPTHTLYDIDSDEPLAGMQISQVSDSDINRVLVWGQFPQESRTYRDIMPAIGLISAEARIEEGSPIPEQNIASTWERTLVKEGTQYWLPRIAQVIAHLTMTLYRGIEVARYSVHTRGIESMWWGHKVQIAGTAPGADPWLSNLVGQTFRIMRIANEYDLQRGTWQSQLNIVPRIDIA